jgi:hypothetical protein
MDEDENAPRVGLTTPSAALAISLKRLEELRKNPPQLPEPERKLSLVPYTAPPPKKTITREQMVKHLLTLDVIFPSQHLSADQMTLRFHTFYADLKGLSDDELAYACERYRKDPGNKFFPTPGMLLALAKF